MNQTDDRRPPSLLNALTPDHRNGSADEMIGYDGRRGQFHNIRVTGGGTLDGSGWQQSEQVTPDETGYMFPTVKNGDRKSVFTFGNLAKNQMLAAWHEQDPGWGSEAGLFQLIQESYGGFDGETNQALYANRRSSLATFRGVSHVYFGDLKVLNPAYQTVMFLESDNMVFAYNQVRTYDANHAVGVEFGNSSTGWVFGNFMNTGGDVVKFSAGQGAEYEEGTSDANPSEKVWIFNNYLREGRGGIAIGSHTAAWIQDILAEQNVLFLTDYGLKMHSTVETGGGARRIMFRDNAMKDIGTHNRYQMNGVTIENRGQIGSPFSMILSDSTGDNMFSDAQTAAQFKHIRIEHNTLDNVSAESGGAMLKVIGYSRSNSFSYPEVFHEDVVISNLTAQHVVATQIDHLKDAVLQDITVTDWDSAHQHFWNFTSASNVKFVNVVPGPTATLW
jgi:exo-poly-alpha-galacturonosidase